MNLGEWEGRKGGSERETHRETIHHQGSRLPFLRQNLFLMWFEKTPQICFDLKKNHPPFMYFWVEPCITSQLDLVSPSLSPLHGPIAFLYMMHICMLVHVHTHVRVSVSMCVTTDNTLKCWTVFVDYTHVSHFETER